MSAAFSILYWTYFTLSCVILFSGAVLLWLVTLPFDRNRTLLHRYTGWWGLLYLRCLPGCRIHVEGRDKIVLGTAYVLVANHQSLTDIMALSALAVPFKWVSKKEVFRWPFIGWNMALNQYVAVDRGNLRNVRQTLTECKSWLERGMSLMMFPEGTRSKTAEIQEFHSGSFKLAADCGCAVVPVVVDGTFPIFRGWRVLAFPGQITIRVLDPVTIGQAGGKVQKFCDVVSERMKQELAAIRAVKMQEPVVARSPDRAT
jgi:1-acyl-sn-glycerol-3-phosphate acyltransferase